MAVDAKIIVPSGSSNGKPIAITSTSGTGQTIHTATSTADEVDVIELFASNESSNDETLTLQIGGTTDYTNTMKVELKALGNIGQDGAIPLGTFTLSGGEVLRAIADTTNTVKVWGNVRRITNA